MGSPGSHILVASAAFMLLAPFARADLHRIDLAACVPTRWPSALHADLQARKACPGFSGAAATMNLSPVMRDAPPLPSRDMSVYWPLSNGLAYPRAAGAMSQTPECTALPPAPGSHVLTLSGLLTLGAIQFVRHGRLASWHALGVDEVCHAIAHWELFQTRLPVSQAARLSWNCISEKIRRPARGRYAASNEVREPAAEASSSIATDPRPPPATAFV